MNDIVTSYFDWLCGIVDAKRHRYLQLCRILFETEFTYTISMDGNRYADGINLRYRFAREADIPHPIIASELDNNPCSILEVMVALALRFEEDIMTNDDYGDRTYIWFDDMITSLGLAEMTDSNIDPEFVDDILSRFLNHDYASNGKGGLFTVNDSQYDLRYVEIWYQAMWYLNSKGE